MIELLLNNGASADTVNGVLQHACQDRSYGVVRMLLKAGADPNYHGGPWGSPLYASCLAEDQKLVSLLLSRGADPNVQSCSRCDNALQTTCAQGNEAIAHLLLERGANPNLYGGRYGCAFQAACSTGNEFIIRLLLEKGADPKYRGGLFDNALIAAIHSENPTIVKILLECGLPVNAGAGYYTYPIIHKCNMYYVDESRVTCLKLLLEHGADPGLVRKGDNELALKYPTALHLANSVAVAELLLSYGAPIDADPTGYGTPLFTNELCNGDERFDKLSELLIHRGADVNATHWNNISPFGVTCLNGNLQIAKLMLEKGPSLEYRYDGPHTAICSHSWLELGYL